MNPAGIAWDRIIAAAAASTLGVLSLGVLIVGVLAYLFFGRSDDRVKLWVFGAVLVAVLGLGAAVLRESGGATRAPAPGPSSAGPAAASDAVSGGSDGPAPAILAKPDDGKAGTAAPDAASPATHVAGFVPSRLAGNWADDDGFTYVFTVAGTRISYTQFLDGSPVGLGEGSIAGRALTYHYVDKRNQDSGTCEGVVAPAGDAIDGHCGDGQRTWGFRIVRAAS